MTLNDEAKPLSNEDLPYYEALKKEFGDKCTEDFCVRVARAFRGHTKNRMQTTLAEAKRIMDWRASLQVDSVLTCELDQTKIFYDCWPSMMYGEDNDGHLIVVDRIADIQVDAIQKNFTQIDKILPHRAQYMERIQWEKSAISIREQRRVYKHICIVDMKGFGTKHASKSVLNHLKPIFDIGQLYYPETLHKLFIINAPMIFYGVWKIVSKLVDPETREKIEVFLVTVRCYLEQKDSDKFLETAPKYGIPLESLPSYLGGNHPGRPMNSTFKPSMPDTPLPIAVATNPVSTQQ